MRYWISLCLESQESSLPLLSPRQEQVQKTCGGLAWGHAAWGQGSGFNITVGSQLHVPPLLWECCPSVLFCPPYHPSPVQKRPCSVQTQPMQGQDSNHCPQCYWADAAACFSPAPLCWCESAGLTQHLDCGALYQAVSKGGSHEGDGREDEREESKQANTTACKIKAAIPGMFSGE